MAFRERKREREGGRGWEGEPCRSKKHTHSAAGAAAAGARAPSVLKGARTHGPTKGGLFTVLTVLCKAALPGWEHHTFRGTETQMIPIETSGKERQAFVPMYFFLNQTYLTVILLFLFRTDIFVKRWLSAQWIRLIETLLKGGQNHRFCPEKSDFLVALDLFLSAVCSVLCWSSAQFIWLCCVRVFSTEPPRKDAACIVGALQIFLCGLSSVRLNICCTSFCPARGAFFHTNGKCAIWNLSVSILYCDLSCNCGLLAPHSCCGNGKASVYCTSSANPGAYRGLLACLYWHPPGSLKGAPSKSDPSLLWNALRREEEKRGQEEDAGCLVALVVPLA